MEAARLVLSHRPLRGGDLALVCSWFEGPEALFQVFPRQHWPLTEEQLHEALVESHCATVVVQHGEAVAFASFSRAEVYGVCTISHLVVAPHARGRGVGRHLIEVMRNQARSRYHARELRVACFNANIPGLLFYPCFGFEPCAVEARQNRRGEPVVLIHFRQPLIPLPRF